MVKVCYTLLKPWRLDSTFVKLEKSDSYKSLYNFEVC